MNYFGSIFNDVLFVPSFLSDNDKQRNITILTEEFVCRHLIPEDFPTVEWNLNSYKKYLEYIYNVYKIEKKLKNLKIQKIIATLQQFIIYLSHTSKGAPKKMVQKLKFHALQLFLHIIQLWEESIVLTKEKNDMR